ncbi:MAG: hypothetical protein NTU73_00545 [Ignavibacteriae bacterium]|nr:hypothetical protein [Ignavibacteriota bacterium]
MKIWELIKVDLLFDIIVFLILLVAFCSVSFNLNPPEAINSDSTKILFPADTSCFKKVLASPNHTILINLLQERETTSNNSIASSESVKMQSRMFYCAILAGLVSLLLTRKEKEKKLLAFILLVMIPLMYVIDVHQKDLIRRNMSVTKITSKAVNQLVNSYTDTIYVLKDDLTAEYEKATERCERWGRKAYTASTPDLLQIVYYFLPWLAIFTYFRCLRRYIVLHKNSLEKEAIKNNSAL